MTSLVCTAEEDCPPLRPGPPSLLSVLCLWRTSGNGTPVCLVPRPRHGPCFPLIEIDIIKLNKVFVLLSGCPV